ncbi:serine/threonine-protein kinase [Streptomyces sp. ISL-94]|uniref:serine/threonine-protein kinase n=1 Tax=Streptomyces sp. ISL-94 TaxID=2819190 RepID=UPI001BE5ACF0|nr:serine/threonine-protein kinase [Streptomyces sp. ISL-94]
MLGRGGMGVVFAAEDTRLRRRVAVKVLSAVGASLPHEMQRRFVAEAIALARIRHRGVVGIHDSGFDTLSGTPYLVMEMLDGADLSVLGAAGALSVSAACWIAAETLDALDAAHKSGVLHRDVKPGNIRVSRTGHVVLYDFGLAVVTEQPRSTRGDDRLIGTPQYMAPERIEGLAPVEATDLYGVGACMHFMLTGRPPFESDPEEFGALVLRAAKGVPSLRNRGLDHLPAGLVEAVDALCARDFRERPTDAVAAAALLRRWADGGRERVEQLISRHLLHRTPELPHPAELPEYDWNQVDVTDAGARRTPDARSRAGLLPAPDEDPWERTLGRLPATAPAPVTLSEVTRKLVHSRLTESSALSRQREAVGLVLRGELQEAAQLLSGVTRFCEETLGPAHPTTLACQYWQAVCLARLGNAKKALELFARVSAHHGHGRGTADA